MAVSIDPDGVLALSAATLGVSLELQRSLRTSLRIHMYQFDRFPVWRPNAESRSVIVDRGPMRIQSQICTANCHLACPLR